MKSLVKKVEAKYLKAEPPMVSVGDMVKARLKVIEGKRERLQEFEGIVIAKRGEGINKSIKIRKISYSIGVERTILLHSPNLDDVVVVKKGKPRRAKLYYLRKRVGKAAMKV